MNRIAPLILANHPMGNIYVVFRGSDRYVRSLFQMIGEHGRKTRLYDQISVQNQEILVQAPAQQRDAAGGT